MKLLTLFLLCCIVAVSATGCGESEAETCFPAGYQYLSYTHETTISPGEFQLDSMAWGPFSVFITGSTSLAEGTRLNAYLLKDDEYVEWWPQQNAVVKDGSFRFRAKAAVTEGIEELPPFEPGYLLRIISRQNKNDTVLLSLDTPSPVAIIPDSTALPEQPELDETWWELISLNDSRLLPATKITISFYDGKATGKADCNHYGGDYTALANGLFNVPQYTMTALSCGKNSDLQSQAYLNCLLDAACYRVTADRMELFDTMTGKRTLLFKRVNKDM